MVWETRGNEPRDRRCWRRRAGLLFVVAVCVAALVVGVGGSAVGASGRSEAASVPSGVAPRDLPAPSAEMVAEVRRQVEERRARREAEAGRVARVRSRRAHAGVSRDGAVAVARDAYGDVVGAPAWAPFRLGGGERLLGYSGGDEARVQLADGTRGRVESTVPLRARNAAGVLAPVDLGLEDHGSFFSPGNPLTALRVGKRLGDGISVGDIGVRMVPGGVEDVQGSLVSGTPFWANVDTDVDMLAKPLPAGVETFWQLRSQDSPEQLRLKLELPSGAQLRQATGPQDMGAVEVVRGGQVVAKIAAPGTRDAEGEPVPTSMRVEGESVVVSVDHRKGDFAYPLLVDPTYTVVDPNWSASNASDFDGWSWYASNIVTGYRTMSDCAGLRKCSTYFNGFPNYPADPNRCVGNASCNGGWGRGLYTLTTNAYMPAAEAAHWVFVAGNAGPEVNIPRAEFKDAWGGYGCAPAGCAIAHMQGLLNYKNWVSSWVTTTGYSYNQKTYCTPSTCDAPTNGQNAIAAVQQIHTPTGGYFPNNLDYLMSASVVMTDNTGPNSLTATHSNQPSGWVQDATETVTASAADGGVGVKEFDVNAPKPDGPNQVIHSCPGNRHGWCPPSWSAPLLYDTQALPEGDNTLKVTAKDAWGNQTDSTPWHARIDRTPPTTQASGALFDHRNQASDHRNEGLYDSGYALHVNGTDGLSGVKSIEVFVDDQPQASRGGIANGTCTTNACDGSLNLDWTFNPDNYTDGDHTIKIITKDQLADQPGVDPTKHTTTTTFPVTIDRRGDIYHATAYEGDPAQQPAIVDDEWAQFGTQNVHRENPEQVITRNVSACPSDPEGCASLRVRTRRGETDPSANDSFSTTTGTTHDDSRLVDTSELLAPANTNLGTPTATGPLADALQPWQYPPPGHGNAYQEFDTSEPASSGDADGTKTSRLWIDATTKMPLHRSVTIVGQQPTDTFYIYDKQRTQSADYPSDEFSTTRPTNVDDESNTQLPPPSSSNPNPPPLPDATELFDQSKQFRIEFGLRSDDSFINSVLANPALASLARFGVALTEAEVQDLSGRLDAQQAMGSIESYGAAHADSYAGSYFDQQHGGLLYVGFTREGPAHLENLRATYPYPDRLRLFTPNRTLADLQGLQDRVTADWEAGLLGDPRITTVGRNSETNTVEVGSSQPDAATAGMLQARYGAGVALVEEAPQDATAAKSRDPITGGIRVTWGGFGTGRPKDCTSAFNAYRETKSGGRTDRSYKIVSAGHCVADNTKRGHGSVWTRAGDIIGLTDFAVNPSRPGETVSTDAASIDSIRGHTPYQFLRTPKGKNYYEPTKGAASVTANKSMVCLEGATTGHYVCGLVIKTGERIKLQTGPYAGGYRANEFKVRVNGGHCDIQLGDSGGPAMISVSGGVKVAGILSHSDHDVGKCGGGGYNNGYFSPTADVLRGLGGLKLDTR